MKPPRFAVLVVLLLKVSMRQVEVLEYPELGMEAVWKIEVSEWKGVTAG